MNPIEQKTAVSADEGIVFGRRINRETLIEKEKGVLIIAPESPSGQEKALEIKKKFESIGIPAALSMNPDHNALLNADRPVVLLGNLADSRCVKYLYYKLMCTVDKSYPGKEGYVIRTMPDPFATGYNVIHIGYSDEEGLSLGVKEFTENIKLPLPFFNRVSCKHNPYDLHVLERIKKTPLPEKIELTPSIHTSFWYMKGFVYYITGDESCLPGFWEGWQRIIDISKKNPALISGTHLYFTQHVEIWWMLESAGLIPDDLRGPIEECIFRWAESPEGIGYAAHHLGRDLPSHNHTMFCGVSLMYIADFFGKYYPSLNQPKEWAKATRRIFESFDNGGWKPYCDDSSYSNQVTLPLVCVYSIFQDDHTFLNTSGKIAAAWIKAMIGQNGIVPSYGDGTTKDPFPTVVTRLLSHYYEDGELRWLHDRIYKPGEYAPDINSWRLFDSGVKPVYPAAPMKINAFPLDRRFYDIWDKNEAEGVRMSVMRPDGPYEQCFDKLSIRTGWDEIEDDFLLIDGLGSNGIHAYNDAMGILDYTSKGIVWLVEENCYRFPEPEHLSMITIARSGYAADIPGYALMEEQKELAPDHLYVRLRLKNYNRCDWVREIHFIKGVCVVFHDTVIPHEDGEYVIQGRFRTPARARLDGYVMKSIRKNPKGEEYELRLSGCSSMDYIVDLEEVPYGDVLFKYGGMHEETSMFNHFNESVETGQKMWQRRYNEKDITVTAMVTRVSGYLKKGESISLTHKVHPARPQDEDIAIEECPEGFLLSAYGKQYRCPTAYAFKNEGVPVTESKAVACMESPNTVYTFDRDITGIYPVDKDLLLLTLQDGRLVFLSDRKPLWEKELGESIHTVDIIKEENMILVGYGPNKLLALDFSGKALWEAKTRRIPTLFDSWEYEYPCIVKVRHFKEKESTYIVAGCGDNQLRVYNLKGEPISDTYVYATVPDVIEFLDIDKDGEIEILAAGSKTTSAGAFRAFKKDGSLVRLISVGIWLSTICSHEIAEDEGRILFACGMNYAKNFKMISVEEGTQKLLFEKILGGTVTAACFNEDRSLIAVGTSKGFVLVFDRNGNDIWNLGVNDIVDAIYCKDGNWTVIGKGGRILVVGPDKSIKKSLMLSQGISAYAKTDDGFYLASKKDLAKI